MVDDSLPPLRWSPRRRVLTLVVAVLVVALVAAALWWTSNGQQRRRAVAGLGDLPGVASAGVSDDGEREAVVEMDDGASVGDLTNLLRRAVPVLTSDDLELTSIGVELGAAVTEVSAQDVGDGGDAAVRAEVVVALADLSSGTVDVPPGAPVLLQAADLDWTPQQRVDQVLDALDLLAAADQPVPSSLWGDGVLQLTDVDAPADTLARAVERLEPLLDDDVQPEAVTGGLVNLTVPDDLRRSRTRALLQATADRLSDVRASGRPVIDRLYAETPDVERGVGVRVD